LAGAGVAIAAAARERLFAAMANPTTALRAQHDWVLFRRLVDARCNLQVAPPPVLVEPPAPPPKLTRYQAIVLRVNPVAGVDHVQIALAMLRQGELPNLRVSRAASAGEISYLGDAELPQASNAYLVAQFGRADFAPPVVGAFVVAAPGVTPALEQRRFAQLADRLGGDTVQVEHLPGRPATLPASEAEGTLIYLINPDKLPPPVDPPPPAPPKANRDNVLLVLTLSGSNAISGAELTRMRANLESATTLQPTLDGLLTRAKPFFLSMYRAGGTGSIQLLPEDATGFAAAASFVGGTQALGHPEVLSVVSGLAASDEAARVLDESFFVCGKTSVLANPLTQVRAGATPRLNGHAVQGLTIMVLRKSF
jgi:hypothetical protein